MPLHRSAWTWAQPEVKTSGHKTSVAGLSNAKNRKQFVVTFHCRQFKLERYETFCMFFNIKILSITPLHHYNSKRHQVSFFAFLCLMIIPYEICCRVVRLFNFQSFALRNGSFDFMHVRCKQLTLLSEGRCLSSNHSIRMHIQTNHHSFEHLVKYARNSYLTFACRMNWIFHSFQLIWHLTLSMISISFDTHSKIDQATILRIVKYFSFALKRPAITCTCYIKLLDALNLPCDFNFLPLWECSFTYHPYQT